MAACTKIIFFLSGEVFEFENFLLVSLKINLPQEKNFENQPTTGKNFEYQSAAGEKLGFGVRFIQKTQAPQGGQRPPQAENFLGIWGRCTQKSRCWDAFRNVFLAQNTPQNPQNFPPPAES